MSAIRPSKIVCVGRNYVEHAKELGNEVPAEPLIFFKPPSSIIGPRDAIRLPAESSRVEFEAEIGVVMPQRLRKVTMAEAEHLQYGFVCVNDVIARDLQKKDGQWGRAKGFDTFCPVGPRVAEGIDWHTLEVICRVNGEERQRGHASQMVFSIPALVVYISRIMTLEAGDLIATGTPAGTAPLAPGDYVEVEIPAVGILSNPVRAE